MKEIWKDVDGYNGDYKISNLGNVLSLKKQQVVLTPRLCGQYYAVCLYDNNNKRKNHYIHKLVLVAFIPNPENKPQGNHIDGIKAHNYVSNLEWCTNSENIRHAYKLGLKTAPCAQTGRFGDLHHLSKKVHQYSINGKYISSFGSVCEASKKTGVNRRAISQCANNETKTSGGYKWSFIANDWSNV